MVTLRVDIFGQLINAPFNFSQTSPKQNWEMGKNGKNGKSAKTKICKCYYVIFQGYIEFRAVCLTRYNISKLCKSDWRIFKMYTCSAGASIRSSALINACLIVLRHLLSLCIILKKLWMTYEPFTISKAIFFYLFKVAFFFITSFHTTSKD